MTAYTGCNGSMTINGAAIVELTGFTFEEATAPVNEPIMDGDCSDDVSAGTKSWSGSIDIFFDPDDAGVSELVNGAVVAAVFQPIPGHTITGDILIIGSSLPVEVDAMLSQNFTYQGKGLPIKTF